MLEANFISGYETVTVQGLTQWDKGQKLQITGLATLPATFQVHFANTTTVEAIVMLGSTVAGVGTVDIPNSLLEAGLDIKAWVYIIDANGSETIKTILFPLVKRTKPADFISEPNPTEQSLLEQTMTNVNASTAKMQTQIDALDTAKANQSDLDATNMQLAEKVNQGGLDIQRDMNKNLSKIDQTMLTDALLQQIAGTTPVNAVPADDSLTTVKYLNGSVTPEKTSFISTSLNLFNKDDVVIGKYLEGSIGSGCSVKSDNANMSFILIPVKPNKTYIISGASYKCFLLSNGIITSMPVDHLGGASKIITTGSSDDTLVINFYSYVYPLDTYMMVNGTVLPSPYIAYSRPVISGNVDIGSTHIEQTLSNIRTIYTNLFNPDNLVTGYYDADSTPTIHTDNTSMNGIIVDVSELTYYTTSGISYKVVFYDSNNQYLSWTGIVSGISRPYTFKTPKNCAKACISFNKHHIDSSAYMIVKGKQLPPLYIQYNNSVSMLNNDVVLFNKDICYISPSGSDSNQGTKDSPFATFQYAINNGYKTIYGLPGVYFDQKIVINNKDNINIICLIDDTADTLNYRYTRVKLSNMKTVPVSFDSTTGLYKGSKTSTTRWSNVFTSKTLTPIKAGTQTTSYNAILWEINGTDAVKHKKLLPVLSLSECQSTVGSFYHDGTNVYINPSVTYTTDIAYKYLSYENDEEVGIYVVNSSNICINGIDVLGFTKENALIYKSENVKFINSLFAFSAYSEGCYFRRSVGECNNCVGYQNCDDAFGAQEYATADFINCKVLQSYDDGISHHDGCHGIILGGLFTHCGKGGLSPTYGAEVTINGVFCLNNVYGLYNVAHQNEGRYTTQQMCISNSVFKNNTMDISIQDYNVLMHSCTYTTSRIYNDAYTSLTEY